MLSFTELVVPKIHQSEIYGTFIELGAGHALTEELYCISGASKTINFSLSPYSRECQFERYGVEIANFRAVSPEMVTWILHREKKLNKNPAVNLFWVSSFQVKSGHDGFSHGWIAYQYRNEPELYVHLTFPRKMGRKQVIQEIGRISLKMLLDILKPDPSDFKYIDGVFRVPRQSPEDWPNGQKPELKPHEEWEQIYKTYRLSCLARHSDIYWVVNPKGQWERFETNFRSPLIEAGSSPEHGRQPILLYKGSFNPLHDGHLGIIKQAQERYPRSPLGLMLSVQTYQKGEIDYHSLQKRIDGITGAGFYCVITEKGMFRENINELKARLPGQEWVFLLGWDTFVRMEPDLFGEKDVSYLIFDREGGMNSLSEDKKMKLVDYRNCDFVSYDVPISSTELRIKAAQAQADALAQ